MTPIMLLKIFYIVLFSNVVICQDQGVYWGLLRALPWPLPVSNISKLLPVLFVDNESLSVFGVPSLTKSFLKAEPLNLSTALDGSLCFQISLGVDEVSGTTPCLVLTNQSLTELLQPKGPNGTFVTYSSGSIPTRRSGSGRTPLTRMLPSCRPRVDPLQPKFMVCQSGYNHHWLANGFSTTHDTGFQGWPGYNNETTYFSSPHSNATTYKRLSFAGNMWDPFVICNSAGACTDATAMLFLSNFSWSNGTWGCDNGRTFKPMNLTHSFVSPNFTANVCVDPPFLWYVCIPSNNTCSSGYITQCWNGTNVGIVMRVPT